ncbi:phosphotransferase [uncultured Anaerococcus sp.]|uniref:phosphotransferase n=1 Tax=uncultured Anaerococcus sp. TaxID=293428 RepID=UPI002889BF6F|nr:phosphotransferase [uncultured Anaerococcus sp.]
MTSDIRNILGHTNIFKNLDQVSNVEKIGSSKYKVEKGDKSYVFALYELDKFDEIENEAFVNEVLEHGGLNPLQIYEKGLMPDLEKSFKVYEYRNEIALGDFLEKASDDEQERIGKEFGLALKKLHGIKATDKVDWQKAFMVRIDQIFYRHGLSEIADDDYILIDFINATRHLTENTAINLLYKDISDKNIRIYSDKYLDLRGIKKLEYGDGIVDFVEINRIAIAYPKFAKSALNSYHGGYKPARKFFRLLGLYQATVILDSIINLRNKTDSFLKKEEINSILEMYDNFNKLTPKWVD